jgi:hypothetical protein
MTTTTTTPPRPPLKTIATPRRGRGAGTATVPDDDVTAAAVAASRDAVATNAKNATNEIGSRRARNLRAAAETWQLCLEQIILYGIAWYALTHKYLQMIPADNNICADICRYLRRYLQISAQISGHASRYLVTP